MYSSLIGKNQFGAQGDGKLFTQIVDRYREIRDAPMKTAEKEFHVQCLNVIKDTIKQVPEYSHNN